MRPAPVSTGALLDNGYLDCPAPPRLKLSPGYLRSIAPPKVDGRFAANQRRARPLAERSDAVWALMPQELAAVAATTPIRAPRPRTAGRWRAAPAGRMERAAGGRRCLSRQPSNDLIHAHGLTSCGNFAPRRARPPARLLLHPPPRARRFERVGLGGNAMSECFRVRSRGPGANCRRRDIGRQAVEAVPFVSSEPLLQLRAGQVDVDQAALARANDGGAVDFPFLQPLRDTRRADTPRASPNSDFRTTAKGKFRV